MNFVADAVHCDIAGAVLRDGFITCVVVQMTRRCLAYDNYLRVEYSSEE